MNVFLYSTSMLLGLLTLSGCNANRTLNGSGQADTIISTVTSINLKKFMGDWYVIANVPTFLEKDAFNAVESYEFAKDGTIKTTFAFNKGGYDGPRKQYHPTGFVRADSDAHWGMQFVWPIKAEYRIVYLDEDYQYTIIGRSKRDYLWIMARDPVIPEEKLGMMIDLAVSLGYEKSAIQLVPHSW